MDYELTLKVDKYVSKKNILLHQVESTKQTNISDNKAEAKKIEDENALKGIDDKNSINQNSKIKKTNDKIENNQEVILANLKFGFNNDSKDFYVRVTRGKSEYQYPTDEMMRLKAFFIAEHQEFQSSAL